MELWLQLTLAVVLPICAWLVIIWAAHKSAQQSPIDRPTGKDDVLCAELELARKIFWLLRGDHIFLGSYNEDKMDWDDGAYPAINCNDVFLPGADAERLELKDIDTYIEVCRKFGSLGSLAWVAVKRGAAPWRPFRGKDQRELDEAIVEVRRIIKGHDRD